MKRTQASVHYRGGSDSKCCYRCSMFEVPNKCADVAGAIRPRGLCDIFAVRKPVIYVIRHGSTAHNRGGVGKDRIRGHADVPMTNKGIFEVQRAADALAALPIAHIYTSDLERAAKTAEIVARKQVERPSVTATKKLRSWDLGPEMEGSLTTPAVVQRIKDLVAHRTRVPPGGESFDQYVERLIGYVKPIFDRIADKGGEIALVCHGRVCQVIDLWAQSGCDADCMHREYAEHLADEPDTVPPGGVVKFARLKGKWRGENVAGTTGKVADAMRRHNWA